MEPSSREADMYDVIYFCFSLSQTRSNQLNACKTGQLSMTSIFAKAVLSYLISNVVNAVLPCFFLRPSLQFRYAPYRDMSPTFAAESLWRDV